MCVCVQPHFARAVCSYLIGEREKGRILFEQTSYNYFGKQQQNLEIMLKTITKIKIEIIEIKKKLKAKQQYTWNNKQFQKHILEIINTKLKELSDQEKNLNYSR